MPVLHVKLLVKSIEINTIVQETHPSIRIYQVAHKSAVLTPFSSHAV